MSSPFASKLGTNYTPKDEEIPQIQALLIDPTGRLELLDAEIAAVQKTLDTLTEERDKLGAYVSGHKALISLVRRLPLDIIQEIFVACMPTHRNCVMSAREAPVILGRICSSWRAISLSTPRLWSSLHIVEPTSPSSYLFDAAFEAQWVQCLEVATNWLARSSQYPLRISLESSVDERRNHVANWRWAADQFLAALIPYAARWKTISLAAPPQMLEALVPLVETDVPILGSIVLCEKYNRYESPTDWNRLGGLLNGPRLSSISIVASNRHALDFPLPWHRLTALSLLHTLHVDQWRHVQPSMPSDAALQIIARCPALRSCALRLVDNSTSQVRHTQGSIVVEHTCLEVFDLKCAGGVGSILPYFLGNLSTPKLHTFTLHTDSPGVDPITVHEWGIIPDADDAMRCFSRFLASSTQLQTIAIDTAIFSADCMTRVLSELPRTVQQLHMNDLQRPWTGWDSWRWERSRSPGLDDSLLDALLAAPCGATLRFLEIQHSTRISDGGLLRFITSMITIQPHPALRRVHVEFAKARQLDILPDLEQAIESGLEVSIIHTPPIPLPFSPWKGLPDEGEVATVN